MNRTFPVMAAMAATLFFSWVGNGAEEVARVRVATYNVEFGCRAAPEEIAAALRPFRLDLIGFTEVPGGDWTARVGKALGMAYHYTGAISSADHVNKYKSILSRFPLTGPTEIIIKGDGWNPASAVKAEIRFEATAVTIWVTHICASEGDSGHAARLAGLLVREKAARFLVIGDLNNRFGSPALKRLEQAGMRAVWPDLHLDVASLFTWNARNPEESEGVIDHILYNAAAGAKAVAGGIIELPRPLSDHKPIWAEITFPSAGITSTCHKEEK